MSIQVGSYVLHKKLAELGSGEVVKAEQGAIRVRFASGERTFSEVHASPHLEVTTEPPAPPQKATARTRGTRKKAAPKSKTK